MPLKMKRSSLKVSELIFDRVGIWVRDEEADQGFSKSFGFSVVSSSDGCLGGSSAMGEVS